MPGIAGLKSDAALQALIAKYQLEAGLPSRDGVPRARRDGPRLRLARSRVCQRGSGAHRHEADPIAPLAARRSAVGRLPAQDGTGGPKADMRRGAETRTQTLKRLRVSRRARSRRAASE